MTRRCRRTGVYERAISLLAVYPFRCQLCARRFRSRSLVRYTRQEVDRREYERVSVRLPATFVAHSESGTGEVSDISLGGCTIKTPVHLTNGDALKLSLHVPRASAPIVVDVAMVRSTPSGAAGLKFQQISPGEHARLRALMAGLVGRPHGVGRKTLGAGLSAPGLWAAAIILLAAAVLASVFPIVSRCVWASTC